MSNGVVFPAEDGIRDRTVTGVQTCALPIWREAPGGEALAGTARVTLTLEGSLDSLGVEAQVSGRRVKWRGWEVPDSGRENGRAGRRGRGGQSGGGAVLR